ncbi:MAG TPA: sigma-70 family RNA polymerase sigma factor [Candidatus Eisenbacteria bacterium]|nr:sigma-70 family RNA polymerase sigma factor [Candidatus Eisenbacteria bacterium]
MRSPKIKSLRYFGDRPSGNGDAGAGAGGRADEKRLVEEARGGDPGAMRRLLSLVSRPAFRFGMTFCRDHQDAEEIAQDVLASLARSLPLYRGESSLSTWAYSVARRACMRRRRRSRSATLSLDAWREEGGHEPAESPAEDPHASIERLELREAVAAAIRALPPPLREAVILRDVEGLSARQAAVVLKIGERAVKSRLHRARVALRATLEPVVSGKEPARPKPGCPDIARSWSLHLEGDVSPAACARLEAHVRECPRCAATCRSMKRNLRACRALRSKRLPERTRRVMRRVAEAPRTWRAAKG